MTARFTIIMQIQDNEHYEKPLYMALDLNREVVISGYEVDRMKLGAELGFGSFSETVDLLKRREFRRDLLIEAAQLLATQLADTMEDAEGWHDASRIKPARDRLYGGAGVRK